MFILLLPFLKLPFLSTVSEDVPDVGGGEMMPFYFSSGQVRWITLAEEKKKIVTWAMIMSIFPCSYTALFIATSFQFVTQVTFI